MKGMNLIKLMGKKVLLVVTVLLLWVLDDAAFFLPDDVVWTLTGTVLRLSGHGDRIAGLKQFWTGEKAK